MKITNYIYPTPLTIALLSDLHNRPYEEILSYVRELRPDIIAITGDVIWGHKPDKDISIVQQQENVLPFLKGCASIAPSFFSLGNHEWMLSYLDMKLIKDTGVIVLDNEFIVYKTVVIGGLTSAHKTQYDMYKMSCGNTDELYPEFNEGSGFNHRDESAEPEISWLDDFEKCRGYKVLLCHHPEYRDKYLKDRKIDLILSGHCHGGQIRICGQGLFAPGQGWLPEYTKGIYDNMIISAGLANTGGIIPRLFNPREVVFISSKHSFVFSDEKGNQLFNAKRIAACELLSGGADE